MTNFYNCGGCNFGTDDIQQMEIHYLDTEHAAPPGTPVGQLGNPGIISTKTKPGRKKPLYVFIGLEEYDVTKRKDTKEK